MNKEIKIIEHETYKEYIDKGLSVDCATWESAGVPLYCDHLTDEDLACIVRTLYDTLVTAYGESVIEEYINNTMEDAGEWDGIDEFRWKEEEELFIEWGAVYCEDIVCPHCDSDDWEDNGNGVLICNDCGKTFNVV